MKRNLLFFTVIIAIMYFSSFISNADNIEVLNENPISLVNITEENVNICDNIIQNRNIIEKPFINCIDSVINGISVHSGDNTDPNYAYVLTDNTGPKGVITAQGETRWFAFILNEKNKVSILAEMTDEMDADLYIFLLDSETGNLNFIGGSASSEFGQSEYYSEVLDSGIYFAAVSSYEGIGEFEISYYQTNVDIQYEVNDSLETASYISLDNKIIGVIDCPYDIDIYKFTVTKYTWVEIIGNLSKDYELSLVKKSFGGSCDPLGESGNNYKFSPGTYYFMVRSITGGYSSSDVTYDITFRKNYESTEFNDFMEESIGTKTGINILQSKDKKITYVNGHKVNINYGYYWDGSNAYGSQIYDITIMPNDSTYCDSMEIVLYKESTKPIMKGFYNSTVLLMKFVSENRDFYRINCVTSGAYAGESVVRNYNEVTVLIDPDSGKIIDIVEPNFYYSFSHQGTNYIKIQNNYDSIEKLE